MKFDTTMGKTKIEEEFDNNDTELMMTVYKDGELQVESMQNTKVLAFNAWSYLTKAEPVFDEIRIRVATEEEIREWNGCQLFEFPKGEK